MTLAIMTLFACCFVEKSLQDLCTAVIMAALLEQRPLALSLLPNYAPVSVRSYLVTSFIDARLPSYVPPSLKCYIAARFEKELAPPLSRTPSPI